MAEVCAPIFLIGCMCSGKTTLGRAFAQAYGLEFLDLDEEIERTAGMPVKEIFRQKGEEEFRRLESLALKEACGRNNALIACGGGTPCRPGAMELMNTHGATVHLLPQKERLVQRMMDGRASRPLIANIDTAEEMEDKIDSLMKDRLPYYKKAKIEFDSSRLESESEIAESVKTLGEKLCLRQ